MSLNRRDKLNPKKLFLPCQRDFKMILSLSLSLSLSFLFITRLIFLGVDNPSSAPTHDFLFSSCFEHEVIALSWISLTRPDKYRRFIKRVNNFLFLCQKYSLFYVWSWDCRDWDCEHESLNPKNSVCPQNIKRDSLSATSLSVQTSHSTRQKHKIH